MFVLQNQVYSYPCDNIACVAVRVGSWLASFCHIWWKLGDYRTAQHAMSSWWHMHTINNYLALFNHPLVFDHSCMPPLWKLQYKFSTVPVKLWTETIYIKLTLTT